MKIHAPTIILLPLTVLVTVLFLVSCSNSPNNMQEPFPETSRTGDTRPALRIPDSSSCGFSLTKGTDYSLTKEEILDQRDRLAASYREQQSEAEKDSFLDSALQVFTDLLVNEIIPYWYGTPWTFEGHTSDPNKGAIACGYFVSTTLKHMGLNLNRYRLAQQGAASEARTLAIDPSNLRRVVVANDEDMMEELVNIPPGFYFAGLDYHVGFFLRNGSGSYFIHSNYIDGYVMAERIEASRAFRSRQYYLANISGNRELAIKWLLNAEIPIIQ
jgi:hypothetical protein